MKGLFLFVLITASAVACAKDTNDSKDTNDWRGKLVTQEFLKQYSGKFIEPDFNESYQILESGRAMKTQVRQVGGGSGSQVPYPTVCSYTQLGTITAVIERSSEDRSGYMDFATHIIEFQVNGIQLTNELEKNSTANKDCIQFLKEKNEMISDRGGLQYSIYSELLGPDSFRVHTSGGGDYEKGGPRTPSTLDEVFTRVTK